jgi:hypothetical protein
MVPFLLDLGTASVLLPANQHDLLFVEERADL